MAQSEKLMPLLLDEIGSGASGSVVRKCSLGTITVAAKVRTSMRYQYLLQYSMYHKVMETVLMILGAFGWPRKRDAIQRRSGKVSQ